MFETLEKQLVSFSQPYFLAGVTDIFLFKYR